MLFNSSPTGNKIRFYTSFFMVALYFALGLLFYFTDIAADTFPVYRKPVGIIMMVYAAVRAYLTIRRERNQRAND
jgi:hypothetical protein